MHILITFVHLKGRSGGELYVYELALQLLKKDHCPVIFTSKDKGPLFDEVRSKGIPVTTDLETIGMTPDIIMGNSQEELVLALLHFPSTPAIFTIHDRFQLYSLPPKLSRVYRYITVSLNYFDAIIFEQGIPHKKVINIPNSVDVTKFKSRSLLPFTPKKALIFSNYATHEGFPLIIKQACQKFGITVDIIGTSVNNIIKNPEEVLKQYDLVFAKGRCALESASMGCAVILCDIEGLGPILTSQNIEKLRRSNLGWRLLQSPITVENVENQIQKYEPADALKVSEYIQQEASLEKMTESLIKVCDDVIAEHQQARLPTPGEELVEIYHYLKQNGIYGTYFQLQHTINILSQKCKQLESEISIYQNTVNTLSQKCKPLELEIFAHQNKTKPILNLLRKFKHFLLKLKSLPIQRS